MVYSMQCCFMFTYSFISPVHSHNCINGAQQPALIQLHWDNFFFSL